MPAVSRSATNSLSKNARLFMGNLAGARLNVASVVTTAITVTSTSELTNLTLYASASPGQLVILSGATAADQGKMVDITAIAGAVITTQTDISASIQAGSIIAVLPPLSCEIFLPSGHSLGMRLTNDYTKGLTEGMDTHNTGVISDSGGEVPFFLTIDSEATARLIGAGVGLHKTPSSGTHQFRPVLNDDGTFVSIEDATFLARDGNSVIQQAIYGGMATKLSLNFPAPGSPATGSLSYLGAGGVREIGDAGRAFSTGANNYIRANFTTDQGTRFTGRDAIVVTGGAFGAAAVITDADKFVQSAEFTYERGAVEDRALGDQWIIKPEEVEATCTLRLTRILQTDVFFEPAIGGANSAEPDSKTEQRVVLYASNVKDPTKTITIDIPRAIITTHEVVREGQSRFKETIEYRGLATLTASGVSTATPLFQIQLVNAISKDIAIVL